ncbi:MAG TPA: DUF177 domain-containing protein [Steroidobacteraceae bacterium]|nr:DUF177 domain-containing protein [Steroidobacteraceae bacterium]
MSSGRPQHIEELVDAMQLAARGGTIRRKFTFAELPRLSGMAAEVGTEPSLVARFHMLGPRVAIAGSVTAQLRTTCQRCLRPVDVPIDDEFDVVISKSDTELDELAETQDAVVADASRFDLALLVEEQLLLAVPLVPLHTSEACAAVSLTDVEPSAEKKVAAAEARVETQHPFANLRELMNKGRD